ncbi:MAG: epoxyqueuosine reductase QueH [Candidatus Omnitrophota bacterium]
MRLLLHICCGPCSIYPFEVLREEGFSAIEGFFYDPNIHPYAEYMARKAAVQEYSRRNKLRVFFHKYDMKNFFRNVCGHEEFGARCEICWRMRIDETARFASQNGYTHFTTTLLISPYQDQKAIKRIAEDAAKKYGVDFVTRDFRNGFRTSQDKAKEEGMYRQKYCGCLFSEQERHEKVTKRVK